MRVLIDECVPRQIKSILVEHICVTVQEMEWSGFENGDLFVRAETEFEVFITTDKNLAFQQNLAQRTIIIVELSSNKWRKIKNSAHTILERMRQCKAGEYITITIE